MLKTTECVLGMYFSALGILILLLLITHMDMEADARTMLVSREYNNDIVIQMCIEHDNITFPNDANIPWRLKGHSHLKLADTSL